ncbi:MAG: glutamine--fructose-6-phosphate transaminase (isomerizing) [Firmicutes bacterium]|nr:glutamine--fructose-6-phosphate transaminase (isomerizing) [Bacillota bacterium]MCL5040515.1 glutamine--fructose-6-phosphate transaminase (isomerizing) [Bacillota bacterium]
MCGIVGYVGGKQAAPFLLDGLKRLEYRGYDSAGLAVYDGRKLVMRKTAGRLQRLADIVAESPLPGRLGIGQTRWATHGRPSDINAHPHPDCRGQIAVVHNGIIENYSSLRQWLKERGHRFLSETDTETIPHLIEEYYQGDLVAAVRQTVARLKGSFALAILSAREPDKIVAVRQGSPLVAGLGDEENYLASDIPAILPHTRQVYILEDGEMAVIQKESIQVTDFRGHPHAKEVFQVHWDPVMAEKGGYEHFMRKEIHEQPRALRDTLTGRLDDNDMVDFGEMKVFTPERLKAAKRIYIVAAGTAYHAGVIGKHLIEKLARVPVEVDLASEFRYRDPLLTEGDLVIVVSQSGETADTLGALREAKRLKIPVLAITNVVGSAVSREADDVIYTWAGPEIAVASTKAYTTQIITLTLFALHLAVLRGTLDPEERRMLVRGLRELPQKAEEVLSREETVAGLAREFARREDVFFIGRGLDYAVAMEGQLKLKEISYIHAEAYPAGELKHGTLALIGDGVPVVALATQETLEDKMVSNITEVLARGARVLALAAANDGRIAEVAHDVVPIPDIHPLLRPTLAVIPLQLLAYHAAVARGADVDKPRNLAKSVTVE